MESTYVRATVLGALQELKVTPARLRSWATVELAGRGSGPGRGLARTEVRVRRIANKDFILRHE